MFEVVRSRHVGSRFSTVVATPARTAVAAASRSIHADSWTDRSDSGTPEPGVRAGWRQSGRTPGRRSPRPPPLPGRRRAGQDQPGGTSGELGAPHRGVGEIAGQDAAEQPAVAAVVETGDHTVWPDRPCVDRVQQGGGPVGPPRVPVALGQLDTRTQKNGMGPSMLPSPPSTTSDLAVTGVSLCLAVLPAEVGDA